MKIKIFISPSSQTLIDLYKIEPNEFLIGVEQGAYLLARNRIAIDRAVGDFDSVNEAEKRQIAKYTEAVSLHPSEKDQTDTELAIDLALSYNPEQIIIYGGLGPRFDHSYANILLLTKGPIVQINEYNMMYVLKPGTHQLQNDYEYISFFALEAVEHLELTKFKYEIKKDRLAQFDPLCISNEGSGTVSFSKGLLLVVHSNDEE